MQTVIYLTRRITAGIFTLWVIATGTFVLMHLVPGGPFDSEKALPPEVKANLERKFKLNLPFHQQYLEYFTGIALRGDFGPSYKYQDRSVNEIISEKLPVSFELGIYSLIVAILISIPAGTVAAYRHNSFLDRICMGTAVMGQALPTFFVGALLIFIVAVKFRMLPAAQWDGWEYAILPTITLGLRPAALLARLTRNMVLETIRSDYVRTARAKGLTEFVVVAKHVLRNSLIPVVTMLAPITAWLITGSFVVEKVFAIPGLGVDLITAVFNRDYSMIMGTTIVYAVIVIGANMLVDVLYVFIDPRIKLE
jgi:oligopeptide transport system permease protein